MVQLPLTPYRNQALFSDHYLADVLPKDNLWTTLIADTRPAMEEIAALYTAYTPSSKEGQIENDLIRPVLVALGHTFEIGPSLQMPGSSQTPDYVFYQNQAALIANKNKILTDALRTQGAYAVGEAEHWECPLDVPTKGASAKLLTNGNPSYQIATYIQHTGLDWGILTNGSHWRLYHRATAHKLDRFYDVDVPALLATRDPAKFAWFYGLFRREAFTATPVTGRGLNYILNASTSYAQSVSNSLKEQVYKALLYIAQGFLDAPANHLTVDDPATLKEIYDNALILLYRLLFIFYAEARDLLPARTNDGYYKEYSLRRMAEIGALDVGRSHLLVGGTKLWHSLKDLFSIIDVGEGSLNVATFNGGLFDPAKHPFLEKYVVGDARLRQAIDVLARVDVQSKQTGTKKGATNREFVDYRDLSERHLGTIYEGLLEFHLVPREPDAQTKFVLAPGDADQWTVEARNDKGERKVTGSYYTPDYIVKYIVEQTVLPVLDAAVADAPDYAAKVDAVLAVKVLDPAMGSGHFLVEATEQIARYLLNLPLPESGTAEVRDLAYWKRRVVQSCIFGVDLNPLAVELAKLSLWLVTVAQNQPLSFLDHHLRVGNALIGARVSELDMLGDPAFQAQLQGALAEVGAIEASEAADAAAVKEQEQRYTAIRSALTGRYGIVADAFVARYFGADYPAGHQWGPFRDWLFGRSTDQQSHYDEWRTSIAEMAHDRSFFHWELEFPEVFFAPSGQSKGASGGFDAVIGNPPYLNAWTMTGKTPQERSAINALFEETGILEGHWDLYIPFVVQALNLARQGGNHSFILPNPVLREKYATALRKSLLSDYSLQSILGFGEVNVFDDVSRQCIVYVVRKDVAADGKQSLRLATASNPLAYKEVAVVDNEVWLNAYNYQIRNDAHYVACLPTLHKIEQSSNLLGQFLYVNVGATVSSKKPKVFTKNDIVTSNPVGNAQRFFDGTNIGRWHIEWQGQWLDYRELDMSGPRSPQMFEAEKLLVRVRTGENERLIAAYDDTKMYCDHTVIVCCKYVDMEGSNAKPSFDGYAKINAGLDLKYILALVNSTALSWFFQNKFATGALQGTFSDVWPQSVRAFPIRRFAFTTPYGERAMLLQEGKSLVRNRDESEIFAFIGERLAAIPEQADVVHDILATLAQEMLDLYKERLAAHAQFRDWLRDNQSVPVDSFKPKAALDDFHTGSYEDFAAWMKKNKREIAYHDDPKYRAAFTHASTEVQGIEARIAATDRLIDRIVYALYGLTENEIAIVEGSAR
jgi:type I restriction-modification system DNA methylase subunit